MRGPGVTITLNDAPEAGDRPGRGERCGDASELVVHQQDIQAVVNALWAGGAEAMTIQGQRVIATTGIKCVGNTVVLHGVPYSPPYRITAIGDLDALQAGAGLQPLHRGLQDLVDTHGLGWKVEHRRPGHHAGVRRHAPTCATPDRRASRGRRPRLSRPTGPSLRRGRRATGRVGGDGGVDGGRSGSGRRL